MSSIRTSCYRGFATQTLRNVLVSAPSVFWVQQGVKVLHTARGEPSDTRAVADDQHLLLVPARTRLQFANQPRQGEFMAQQLMLLSPVKPSLLALSDRVTGFVPPLLTMTAALRQLCLLSLEPHSAAMQQQIAALWQQQRAEVGALRYVFSAAQASVSEQLQQLFASNPAADHQIEPHAAMLGMSRATLIRRLHAEGTTFRQLLRDCRMNHALALLQQGQSLLLLPSACGYDSEARFRLRFVDHFGITPQAYVATLQPAKAC